MPAPWQLIVDGIRGGADLFSLPTYADGTTPYVLPESVSVQQAANGGGASISFEVVQQKTSGTPWFSTTTFADNARVRLFDTRFSASTAIVLGFITSIDASLLPSGQGTRATISAQDPTAWLEKVIVRKGKIGSKNQPVGGWYTAGTTDQQIIQEVLNYVGGTTSGSYSQDAATKLIFDATLAPTFVGASKTIGSQRIEPGTLNSALDTIRALAEGSDGIVRRYWVDEGGRLNYGRTGTAPGSPTAPIEIITSGTPTVGSTSAKTTVYANSIRVNLDHDAQIDRMIVQTKDWGSTGDRGTASAGNSVDPYARTAGSAFPYGPGTVYARPTGPRSEVMKSLGAFRGLDNLNRANYIDTFTNALFATTYRPKQSISVSITGANSTATGTPDLSFGFVQGYTGGSPYTLTKRIAAGQYITLTAPALDLSGLYRIENMTLGFERGSMIAKIDLELGFRKKGIREILLGEK